MKTRRISPEYINNLDKDEIFVFGSNESGRHGKGAAKTALRFGAKYGVPYGLRGQTFAIPTKDKNIRTLPVDRIKPYVEKFIDFAKQHPDKRFLVTEIGCGLAGFKPSDIAPLFLEAKDIKNIYLPERFVEFLENNKIFI